jgi:hypothetical protein
VRVRLALMTFDMCSPSSRMARSRGASHRGRLGSWLSLGLEFVEGLGGLGKGVGEGLVPVHVGAAGAEFSRALPAQSFRHDQAERSENR